MENMENFGGKVPGPLDSWTVSSPLGIVSFLSVALHHPSGVLLALAHGEVASRCRCVPFQTH